MSESRGELGGVIVAPSTPDSMTIIISPDSPRNTASLHLSLTISSEKEDQEEEFSISPRSELSLPNTVSPHSLSPVNAKYHKMPVRDMIDSNKVEVLQDIPEVESSDEEDVPDSKHEADFFYEICATIYYAFKSLQLVYKTVDTDYFLQIADRIQFKDDSYRNKLSDVITYATEQQVKDAKKSPSGSFFCSANDRQKEVGQAVTALFKSIATLNIDELHHESDVHLNRTLFEIHPFISRKYIQNLSATPELTRRNESPRKPAF